MHFFDFGLWVMGYGLWVYGFMGLYIDGEILHRNLRRWWILLRAHCVNDKLGGVKSA